METKSIKNPRLKFYRSFKKTNEDLKDKKENKASHNVNVYKNKFGKKNEENDNKNDNKNENKNDNNKNINVEEEKDVEEEVKNKKRFFNKYKGINKEEKVIDNKEKEKEKLNENENKKEEHISNFRRWKFRRPETKNTIGKEIKEETESTTSKSIYNNKNNINEIKEKNIEDDNNEKNEEDKNNENNKENNEENTGKNNNEKNTEKNINPIVQIQKIPGIPEKLLNHLNLRINKILKKCTIPLMNVEDYILYEKIGEGSYGIIFRVIDKKDNKEYALKKIISNKLKKIGEFTQEFELVHQCEHPNIMKIYKICIRILDQTTFALYVLMELSEGDWDKEIKKKLSERKNYSEKELIDILYQLSSALLYIQEKYKISHRDIKPQNILIFKGGKYKLADFGEAKEAKVSKQINTLKGTELYMSPLLYNGLKHERNDVNHNPFKSDVFSLGFCFLYASALNFNLLYEVRDVLDNKSINIILHKFLSKFYSEKLILLLASMLEIDEGKRYDFQTIKTYIEANYKD